MLWKGISSTMEGFVSGQSRPDEERPACKAQISCGLFYFFLKEQYLPIIIH